MIRLYTDYPYNENNSSIHMIVQNIKPPVRIPPKKRKKENKYENTLLVNSPKI